MASFNCFDNSSEFILHAELERWWDLPPEQNVSDYILRKVREHAGNGHGTWITNPETGESLSYSKIPEISGRIASKFFKLGLEPGDTVIYSTHDPISLYVFMLGVLRANGVVRSCYPEELGDALVRRIRESKATFLACDKAFANECLKAVKSISEWNVRLVVFGGAEEVLDSCCISISAFYQDDGSALPESSRTLEDIALVLPTSGTTGDSKGAIYTHKILLENITIHELMPYTDADQEPTIITSRQTHYVGSITALSFLTKGRQLLMSSTVTVRRLLETVDKFRVRSILAFPTYLTGMMAHPDRRSFNVSSLYYLTAAGQVIQPASMALIKRTLPNLRHFINLYGMTEAGLLASTANWAALRMDGSCAALPSKDYSVGKLPPGTSLKVLDLEKGHTLGSGCQGELCFRTEVTTAGYLSRPEDEKQTFLGQGWVKTGDIGYYSKDGFVFVLDRAKEIFKWNSNHVSPSEIENVLLRHPAISQAAVVGVPVEEGHVPRGFIVLKEEKASSVSKDELIEFVGNNLPPYKHLKGGLFVLPQLPIGKTGKVSRQLLADLSGMGSGSGICVVHLTRGYEGSRSSHA